MISLLIFLGVSTVGGGIEMLLNLDGGRYLPQQWLDDLPLIDSFLIPGLVLLLGFGAGSLLTAYGVWRRPQWRWLRAVERFTGRHWAWSATILLGAGQVVWIALELVYLPGLSWLEVVYGLIGLALVLLPLTPSVRDRLRSVPDA
jgi:hypothetical protein